MYFQVACWEVPCTALTILERIAFAETFPTLLRCLARVPWAEVQVKRLAAVETFGSASVICADKTGTITEGKMAMVKVWSGWTMYNVH